MRKIAALLVVFPLVAAAQEAAPQYPPPYAPAAPQQQPPSQYPPAMPPRYDDTHRHLGFFIRPELGFGGSSGEASSSGLTVKVSGNGGTFGLAIGGAVTENFILAAHVWDLVLSSPDVKVTYGGSSATITADSDTSAGLVGYGVLMNWYFMPFNLYLAVTPSLTRLVWDDGATAYTSEWGFGIRGALGKEWWVSNHWGLGAAAALMYSSNKDSSDSGAPTWGTTGFTVSFSATYN